MLKRIVLIIFLFGFVNSALLSQGNRDTTCYTDNFAGPEEDARMIFEKVEIEPYFLGGSRGWIEFLKKNINVKYLISNINDSMSHFEDSINAAFIVSKKSRISNIEISKGSFKPFSEEIARILKISCPYWTPGLQNGRSVNSRKIQPVLFSAEKRTDGWHLFFKAWGQYFEL